MSQRNRAFSRIMSPRNVREAISMMSFQFSGLSNSQTVMISEDILT